MSKSTPGPWAVERCNVTPCFHVEAGAYPFGTSICEIAEDPREGNAEANARLIASAPTLAAEVERLRETNAELRAALVQAATELDEAAKIIAGTLPGAASIFSKAAQAHRAAIAKAEAV